MLALLPLARTPWNSLCFVIFFTYTMISILCTVNVFMYRWKSFNWKNKSAKELNGSNALIFFLFLQPTVKRFQIPSQQILYHQRLLHYPAQQHSALPPGLDNSFCFQPRHMFATLALVPGCYINIPRFQRAFNSRQSEFSNSVNVSTDFRKNCSTTLRWGLLKNTYSGADYYFVPFFSFLWNCKIIKQCKTIGIVFFQLFSSHIGSLLNSGEQRTYIPKGKIHSVIEYRHSGLIWSS